MVVVFVCGYGKIGAIKANRWKNQLGAKVFVCDKNPLRVKAARQDGFLAEDDIRKLRTKGLPDNALIDISVPAGYHVSALREALAVCKGCTTVLMEKPIVSSRTELAGLQRLTKALGECTAIFVDETYYASKGLKRFKELLKDKCQKSEPLLIDVDFFKNRVPDVQAGRFTDSMLGAYGVELPHMLACLKYLDFDKGTLTTNVYYTNVLGLKDSEGLVCEYALGDLTVRLTQILGPFSINHTSGEITPNPLLEPTRCITVHFRDDSQLKLHFGPLPGIGRYHSQITAVNDGTALIESFEDNHLRYLLRQVMLNARGKPVSEAFRQLAGVETAMGEARKLISLRAGAVLHDGRIKSAKP